MLRRSTVVLGTVVALTFASWVVAQPPGGQRGRQPGGFGGRGGPGGFGGSGFGGGVTTLLAMAEVQKELGVTEAQKGLIDDMLQDLRGSGGRSNFGDFRNLSEEERRKRFEDMRKQAEERTKKAEELVNSILEPKQVERLGQLRIQRDGLSALDRPEVAEKLGLTQEQKDKIRKLREDSRPAGGTTGGFENFRNMSQEEREKLFAQARERREKTNADIVAVLTADQKSAWEKMQGAKFEFPQSRGFGGGQGRGGFGGQGSGERKRPDRKKDN